MKSHECDCTRREIGRLILPTLCVVLCLFGLLELGRITGRMPPLPVSLYPEYTMLSHQSRTARRHDPANLLLFGDSTCLMGVDARELSGRLPAGGRALNLALLISLDLKVYGEELADFAASNPGQVRAVVLLVTPTKILNDNHSDGAQRIWDLIHHPGTDSELGPESEDGTDWMGARLLRKHWLSHLLATPLRGNGAETLGFTAEVDTYMTEHRGSLRDFGLFIPRHKPGPWEARPATAVEADTRLFRAKVPAGAKLFIGFTPAPKGLGGEPAEEKRKRLELLGRWNEWVKADVLLTNLPPTMPNVYFSATAHLNELGQKKFTKTLARELGPYLK